jgi:hypothetical protein
MRHGARLRQLTLTVPLGDKGIVVTMRLAPGRCRCSRLWA